MKVRIVVWKPGGAVSVEQILEFHDIEETRQGVVNLLRRKPACTAIANALFNSQQVTIEVKK